MVFLDFGITETFFFFIFKSFFFLPRQPQAEMVINIPVSKCSKNTFGTNACNKDQETRQNTQFS